MSTRPVHRLFKQFNDASDNIRGDDGRRSEYTAIEQLESEAYARGVVDGRTETERQIEILRAEYAQALKTEREKWSRDEGEKLASDIFAQIETLVAEICGEVAIALGEILSEAVKIESVKLLSNTISLHLNEQVREIDIVSGPPELISTMFEYLDPKVRPGIKSEKCVSDEDVVVHVGSTRFATRIREWKNTVLRGCSTGLVDE